VGTNGVRLRADRQSKNGVCGNFSGLGEINSKEAAYSVFQRLRDRPKRVGISAVAGVPEKFATPITGERQFRPMVLSD
jgi:hypothetical protein